MKGIKKPSWATPTKELNKWKKAQGVFMFSGNQCQVMIVDLDDPIGILIQKPVRISRDEGVIVGSFCLNEHEVRAGKKEKREVKPYYFAAPYVRASKCFVYQCNGAQLPLILGNPEIRYVDGKDREQCKKVLEMSRHE